MEFFTKWMKLKKKAAIIHLVFSFSSVYMDKLSPSLCRERAHFIHVNINNQMNYGYLISLTFLKKINFCAMYANVEFWLFSTDHPWNLLLMYVFIIKRSQALVCCCLLAACFHTCNQFCSKTHRHLVLKCLVLLNADSATHWFHWFTDLYNVAYHARIE